MTREWIERTRMSHCSFDVFLLRDQCLHILECFIHACWLFLLVRSLWLYYSLFLYSLIGPVIGTCRLFSFIQSNFPVRCLHRDEKDKNRENVHKIVITLVYIHVFCPMKLFDQVDLRLLCYFPVSVLFINIFVNQCMNLSDCWLKCS